MTVTSVVNIAENPICFFKSPIMGDSKFQKVDIILKDSQLTLEVCSLSFSWGKEIKKFKQVYLMSAVSKWYSKIVILVLKSNRRYFMYLKGVHGTTFQLE